MCQFRLILEASKMIAQKKENWAFFDNFSVILYTASVARVKRGAVKDFEEEGEGGEAE